MLKIVSLQCLTVSEFFYGSQLSNVLQHDLGDVCPPLGEARHGNEIHRSESDIGYPTIVEMIGTDDGCSSGRSDTSET
jgi:hypothetical protein